MESQIHKLEQEAYRSVLRAFRAQSDSITWEKEGLMTELRKELRVSDDEHKKLLTRVNADEIVCRIGERRKACENHPTASQPMHELVSSPTFLESKKKQKTSGGPDSNNYAPSATLLTDNPSDREKSDRPDGLGTTTFRRPK